LGVKQKASFPLSGRDPLTISQGVGKLERRLWEDEQLEGKITDLAENLVKERKRIVIYLCLTPLPGTKYRHQVGWR
jgi:hypothetical protein